MITLTMAKDPNKYLHPLWLEMYQIDKGKWTNPGIKFSKMLSLIADRIFKDYNDNWEQRNHTAEDVREWLLEQASKADKHERYNYTWQKDLT